MKIEEITAKVIDQDRTYWKADPTDLKKHYMEVLPYLSLDKAKVKDVESKEFKEYIEKSKEKDEVVSALVKEMAEMKERNQARDKFLVTCDFNLFWKNK